MVEIAEGATHVALFVASDPDRNEPLAPVPLYNPGIDTPRPVNRECRRPSKTGSRSRLPTTKR
jgi:hypothetical protein